MNRILRCLRCVPVWVCLILLGGPALLGAEVVRVVVDRREDVLGGRLWGEAGVYEKLVGRIYFEFDPTNPANLQVVDLQWAPRNDAGRVEAWANFMILQPKEPGRRRGMAWVEVSNRGGKASFEYFNRAASGALDPSSNEDFGDGLLLEAGLTLIWVGWQWDVPDQGGYLKLHVPTARLSGSTIEGLVRADWTVDQDIDVLALGRGGHRAYVPVDPDSPTDALTVRGTRLGTREVVPRERWSYVTSADGQQPGQWTQIALEGGFQAGRIYELVYRSRDPRIAGLGLCVIRDVISYAKYDLESVFPVRLGVAFGVSEAGRFLRHFLYQGFNVDEKGRKAFDGMLIHAAGAGRGSFNHRFAQPSRGAHRYSDFFYPTDLFPFTSRTQRDPVSGREDGLFARTPEDRLPKVIYTNTGYEYWGRAASLIHTSIDGRQDVEPMENERIYQLAGAQRSVGAFPPTEGSRMEGMGLPFYRGNPLDLTLTLRALGQRLLEWVEGSSEPPPNAFPRVGNGTLVPVTGLAFPPVPGVQGPTVAQEAYRMDYGPRWWSDGIIDREPPGVGPAFPSQVSQVDGLGNEIAGVRGWELRVPLATYAPWNLRVGLAGGADELTDFVGTFIPLSGSEAERALVGDPRPSVEALYPSKEAYLERARGAARELVREGFLLPRDAVVVAGLAEARWDWVASGVH